MYKNIWSLHYTLKLGMESWFKRMELFQYLMIRFKTNLAFWWSLQQQVCYKQPVSESLKPLSNENDQKNDLNSNNNVSRRFAVYICIQIEAEAT